MTEITIDFIEKRLQEQRAYLGDLANKHTMDPARKHKLRSSAYFQLIRFLIYRDQARDTGKCPV